MVDGENTRPKMGPGPPLALQEHDLDSISTSLPGCTLRFCGIKHSRSDFILVALIWRQQQHISADKSSGQLISTWLDWGISWMQGKQLKWSWDGRQPLRFVRILCQAGVSEGGLMFPVESPSMSSHIRGILVNAKRQPRAWFVSAENGHLRRPAC